MTEIFLQEIYKGNGFEEQIILAEELNMPLFLQMKELHILILKR